MSDPYLDDMEAGLAYATRTPDERVQALKASELSAERPDANFEIDPKEVQSALESIYKSDAEIRAEGKAKPKTLTGEVVKDPVTIAYAERNDAGDVGF